ncbi:MAG: cytochrome c-type biogenesis CcmF C-terminal domain-containing protein [Caldilineaceae bacterium]
MFSELLVQDRISVAAPFFNKVNGPLFLILFLLMGVGPLLGWRRTTLAVMRRQFTWPLVFAVVVAIAAIVYDPQIFAVIGLAVCGFVAAAIVQEFVRGLIARRTATNENHVVALGSLLRRNGRRYGGYIVHLGMVMMGVAIIGNEFYLETTNVTLVQNEGVELANYEIVYTGLDTERGSNVTSITAHLDIYDVSSGRMIASVVPHRNLYDKNPDMPTSEVGLHMNLVRDVYVVLNGWEDRGATATFSVFVNPLTIWLWIGGIVLVLGTLIASWPHPARRAAPVAEPAAYAALNLRPVCPARCGSLRRNRRRHAVQGQNHDLDHSLYCPRALPGRVDLRDLALPGQQGETLSRGRRRPERTHRAQRRRHGRHQGSGIRSPRRQDHRRGLRALRCPSAPPGHRLHAADREAIA